MKIFLSYLSIFILLIIIDQSTKIFTAKIMLNNMFENIEIFPFLNIVLLEILELALGFLVMEDLLNRYFFTSLLLIIGSILLIISFLILKN